MVHLISVQPNTEYLTNAIKSSGEVNIRNKYAIILQITYCRFSKQNIRVKYIFISPHN